MTSNLAVKKEHTKPIERAASQTASIASSEKESRQKLQSSTKVLIWPEWSDSDINSEKWDVPHKAKEKEKGKSPVSSSFFDDPEGKVDFPPSLRVAYWKRPIDYIIDKNPVVVDGEYVDINEIDLMTNDHLFHSEAIRYIVSDILALWQICQVQSNVIPENELQPGEPLPPPEFMSSWKPWEHIYTLTKVGKGPNIPSYNPYGKYAVKLYWLGSWRKIIVDDTLPFDESDNMLLPSSSRKYELWPMLLSKALFKIMALDYPGRNNGLREFGDFSVLQCLTGWIPEYIPMRLTDSQTVWRYLKGLLPEWKLPEQEKPEPEKCVQPENEPQVCENDEMKPLASEKTEKSMIKEEKVKEKTDLEKQQKTAKEKSNIKEGKGAKDDKKKEKDKHKDKEKVIAVEKTIPDVPENVIFATYSAPANTTAPSYILSTLADMSERLRQLGFSHLHSHSLLVKQSRSCPLERPPEPEVIPAWKLIRPRQKKPFPTDMPKEAETRPKPIQCLQVTSPFVNYGVSNTPLPIPAHRRRHRLQLDHQTMCRLRSEASGISILEVDENVPEIVTPTPPPPPPPVPLLVSEPSRIEEKEENISLVTLAHSESRHSSVDVALAEYGIDSSKPVDDSLSEGGDDLLNSPETDVMEAEEEEEHLESANSSNSTMVSPKQLNTESHVLDTAPTVLSEAKPQRDSKKRGKSPKTRKGSGKHRGRSSSPKDPKSRKRLDSKSTGKPDKTPATETKLAPTPATAEGTLIVDEGAAPVLDSECPSASGSAEKEPPEIPVATKKPTDLWIDFEDFCGKVFSGVYVFHKTNTYAHNHKFIDMKSTQQAGGKESKKASQVNMAPVAEEGAPHFLFVESLKPIELILAFSSLCWWPEPPASAAMIREISKKGELTARDEGSLSPPFNEPGSSKSRHHTCIVRSRDIILVLVRSRDIILQPGHLRVERYNWRHMAIGPTIMELRTTGCKAAGLLLPEGRHVFKVFLTSNLAHHLHICSSTPFTFGDEDAMVPHITKESCQYLATASDIMAKLGVCLDNFDSTDTFWNAWCNYTNAHCPNSSLVKNKQHYEAYYEALYGMLRKFLSVDVLTPDMVFAWRVFNIDPTTKSLFMKIASSRVEDLLTPPPTPSVVSSPVPVQLLTSVTARKTEKAAERERLLVEKEKSSSSKATSSISKPSRVGAGSPQGKGEKSERKEKSRKGAAADKESQQRSEADLAGYHRPENWPPEREPTPDEMVAAIKIQKTWRGFFTRKLLAARYSDSPDIKTVYTELRKAWHSLSPQSEQAGQFLLKALMKIDPIDVQRFSFASDVWNKVAYADYQGNCSDQPLGAWFIIFRDVFFVQEDCLCLPRFICTYPPGPGAFLRIIDNDTFAEMPRIFAKNTPRFYKKNKNGYTFVAEGRATTVPVTNGRWRLKLFGNTKPLPTPNHSDLVSSFTNREIRDYYVPNSKDLIFRQLVTVSHDCLVTLQMSTSKPDVYIHLQILDNDCEIVSSTGKGHVVLPAFTFLKDRGIDTDSKRSSSRGSNKVSSPPTKRRTGSGKNTSRAASVRSRTSSADGETAESKPHKYVIQARLLYKSWPLSESNWHFVHVLREIEKNEMRLNPIKIDLEPYLSMGMGTDNSSKVGSDSKSDLKGLDSVVKRETATTRTKSKGKSSVKDKTSSSSSSPTSRSPSTLFDSTKAHWTLRIVCDSHSVDNLSLRKDTERYEEIRAMKKAWEEADPGRMAKAMQSRLNYLKSRALDGVDENELIGMPSLPPPHLVRAPELEPGAVEPLSNEPPPTPKKEILQPFDIKPFLRYTDMEPVFADEKWEAEQMELRKRKMDEYREWYEDVLRWRKEEKQHREWLKKNQIEHFEKLQASLDDKRKEVFEKREAIRQRHLEAERKRQEELEAAAEAAALKEQADKKGKKGKTSPKTKRK